jgi:ubiquinone/menaquinone biosynthesis C-methylase UbiE
VDANARNNRNSPRLTLFQGDIFAILMPKAYFDKVLCLGVLQHTPDPERAFKSLAAFLKPGGLLAIDAYAKRMSALLRWKYLMRPLTRRMDKRTLYRMIERGVPTLVPATATMRRHFGRAGARLIPIVEYSHLG